MEKKENNLQKSEEFNAIHAIKKNQKENNFYLNQLVIDYNKKQKDDILIENIFKNESYEFILYYCISESLNACENAIAQNKSRELSLVRTKLQEALFWLNES